MDWSQVSLIASKKQDEDGKRALLNVLLKRERDWLIGRQIDVKKPQNQRSCKRQVKLTWGRRMDLEFGGLNSLGGDWGGWWIRVTSVYTLEEHWCPFSPLCLHVSLRSNQIDGNSKMVSRVQSQKGCGSWDWTFLQCDVQLSMLVVITVILGLLTLQSASHLSDHLRSCLGCTERQYEEAGFSRSQTKSELCTKGYLSFYPCRGLVYIFTPLEISCLSQSSDSLLFSRLKRSLSCM